MRTPSLPSAMPSAPRPATALPSTALPATAMPGTARPTPEQPSRSSPPARPIHPLWMRITHWLNALAVLMLVTSGWRIYDATPLFAFRFPAALTLGGWLGGALQWHFAAMWLLAANGLVYLAANVASGRLAIKFFPVSPRGIWRDGLAALRGRLSHADPRHYNQVQRLAYLFVIVDSLLLVLSGLVLWKSVQFGVLRELLGGYESARRIHFFAMSALVAFVGLHLVMVALVPKTLLSMLRGN